MRLKAKTSDLAGYTIPSSVAEGITREVLAEHRFMLTEKLMRSEEGEWMHQSDVELYKRIINSIDTLLNEYM
jgi:hypothetical protein